jgi:uncharacterized membrane protein
VSAGMRQAKQPVSAALAGPYGHPLHPLLVTVPIGAWLASLVFDVASRFAAHPGFLTQGAEWLIGIGVAGALAAATVGFLDLLAIAPGTPAFRTAIWHMSLNLVVTGTYAANFAWRHATYANGGQVPAGMLALSAAAFAVLGVSGFLGGKLAYRYGVRVADESTQAEGFALDTGGPGGPPWQDPSRPEPYRRAS